MPIAIKYLDGGKGVVLTMSGTVNGEELIAATEEVFSRDLVAEPYFYCLADGSSIDGANISADQIRYTAALDVAASKTIPRFIVAAYAKDDLPFALARMWQVFAEPTGWDTRVFRSRLEAVTWVKQRVLGKFGVAVSLE